VVINPEKVEKNANHSYMHASIDLKDIRECKLLIDSEKEADEDNYIFNGDEAESEQREYVKNFYSNVEEVHKKIVKSEKSSSIHR
jgi:hypothetical protein